MPASVKHAQPTRRRTRAVAPALQARLDLAACYRMFARRGMDDLIYTHLSARIPDAPGRFLFIPFGMLFEEVTASNLLEVDIAARPVGFRRCRSIPAGWIVHRTVYEAQPAAKSVMHLHTICGTAVSAQQTGLLPVNQFGITYAGQIGYHDYDGPGLRPEEQKRFVADLGDLQDDVPAQSRHARPGVAASPRPSP